MTSVYLLCTIIGLGLLMFSTLGGDDDGADAADLDDGDSGGATHFLLGLFSTRNLTFLLAAFGVTGLLLTAFGVAPVIVMGTAAALGVVSMGLAHGVFTWLRRTDSSVDILGDEDFHGALARVVLPISAENPGQIACLIAGREMYLTATLAGEVDAPLAVGQEVIILSTSHGVASVMAATQLEIPPST